MRKLAIMLLNFYQKFLSRFTGQCKFVPSCSCYSKEAYEKHSFIKATWLTISRLARCTNPFYKGRYEPVPDKKNKDSI